MQAKEDERAGLVEKVKDVVGKYRRLQEQAKALKLKYDSVASKNAALQQMSGWIGVNKQQRNEATRMIQLARNSMHQPILLNLLFSPRRLLPRSLVKGPSSSASHGLL